MATTGSSDPQLFLQVNSLTGGVTAVSVLESKSVLGSKIGDIERNTVCISFVLLVATAFCVDFSETDVFKYFVEDKGAVSD